MKIKQKLIIWFMIISLIVGFVGILDLYTNNNVVKSFERGEKHFGSIIAASNEVSSYAKRAQGHALLFLTLHDETDRKKTFMRIASLREQSSIIEENITNPEARQILRDINSKTDELQSVIESLFKSYDNETNSIGKFELEDHESEIRKLDDLGAEIRSNGLELANIEIRLQTEQQDSAKKNAEFLYNIILLISAGSFIIALFLGFVFARDISNPIIEIKNASNKIGNGDFKTKIKIQSKDELGELAASFNKMAEDIEKSINYQKQMQKVQFENERLIYASKAKSDFLANMSHELRTPLNSVIGFSELLRQNTSGNLSEKQEHHLDNIIMSSKFLLNLINDILDLSKVESGKMELAIEKVSVPAIINESLILINEKAAKRSVILKKELDPQLDIIEIDSMRFKQVLFNLFSNALKFSKLEGGTITITAKKDENMAKFSVTDTGIGIREEDLSKLFNIFEQLDSGITRHYGGSGLGLAISKKLIELHGGNIWAESIFGEGSTFYFTIPIKRG